MPYVNYVRKLSSNSLFSLLLDNIIRNQALRIVLYTLESSPKCTLSHSGMQRNAKLDCIHANARVCGLKTPSCLSSESLQLISGGDKLGPFIEHLF